MMSKGVKAIFGLAALISAGPASAAADPATYMPAQLIAETQAPRPGSTILVGFKMTPKAGWHGYWSNPGDSGLVPTVEWTAPPGVSLGPLLHPAPTLISDSGIDSFVHDGPHVLLSRLTVRSGVSPGTRLPLKGKLNWAACTATQCVPLSATFTLDLVAGDGAKGPHWAAVDEAKRKLPASAPDGRFRATGKTVRLDLPPALTIDRRSARFFPDDNDWFETAQGRAVADSDGIAIVGPSAAKLPDSIGGVLSDGRRAYRLAFRRAEEPMALAADAEAKEEAAVEAPDAAIETPAAEPPAEAAAAQSRTERGSHLWLWGLLAAAAAPAGALTIRKLRRRRRAQRPRM